MPSEEATAADNKVVLVRGRGVGHVFLWERVERRESETPRMGSRLCAAASAHECRLVIVVRSRAGPAKGGGGNKIIPPDFPNALGYMD